MASTFGRRAGPGEDEAWAKTRAVGSLATQVMGDEESYLATTRRAIGRRIDAEHHELFVVCDPAQALQLQLEHHAPDYIALHDLGLEGSYRLLQGVAAATRRPVQQLVVRRQGFGVPLATLRFVELPGATPATQVRIYSTRAEVDDPAQAGLLAQVLLGHSRLGVILVGAHAVTEAAQHLRPLREAMAGSGWRNRQLLWLPIGAEAAAAAPGSLVGRLSTVQLHTAAPQADLAQAWPVISSLWDRLRSAPADAPLPLSPFEITAARPVMPPAPAPAPAAPPVPAAPPARVAPTAPVAPPAVADLAVPPALPVRAVAPAPSAAVWQAYVRECAALPGVISCCVFDLATERSLAHAGNRPGPAALAAQGAALYESLCHGARSLGLAPGQPEMALTLAEHHLILHPLAQHPGLALHMVLDAHLANLTLVRMKLHRMDPGGPFAAGH